MFVSIGMFWLWPASVPTGAIEFADATADVTWSMPMPSAASASGLTSARTANFWAPKTCTSPTPSIVESAGSDDLLGEVVELGQGQGGALHRDQHDRSVGRVDLR